MEHKGTERIETERLILRRLTVNDADSMYNNWAKDPQVTKFLTWPPYENVEGCKSILEDWTSHYEEKNYYQWGIELKDTHELIGTIGVVDFQDDIQMLRMGYCMGKNWWNKGIMSEALEEVINFLFEKVGVNRIEARHDVDNVGSGKVMAKCGMKYEGCHRQGALSNAGLHDIAIYSILKNEYKVKN